MRLPALLLAALIAWSGTASAAEPPVPLLWKASNGERSVYLLGSFHMLKASASPLSGDVDAAFDDAEQLLFEMPRTEMGSIALSLKIGPPALRHHGKTLANARQRK